MPEVGGGIAVRWVDPGRAVARQRRRRSRRRTTHAAAVVARVALRYDDTKADLVHDDEYEAVLYPLSSHVDVTTRDRPSTTTTATCATRPRRRSRTG